MNRKDVYKLIDGEREYQDNLPPSRTNDEPRTVGDYITMLGYYYTRLQEAWTVNPSDEQALDVMRKIGGIAVHCMEDHGAPGRAISGDVGEVVTAKKAKKLKADDDIDVSWPFPVRTKGNR